MMMCLFFAVQHVSFLHCFLISFVSTDKEGSERGESRSYAPGEYAQKIQNIWINITGNKGIDVRIGLLSYFSMHASRG